MHWHSFARQALAYLRIAAEYALSPLAHLNERTQGLLISKCQVLAADANVVQLDIVEEASLVMPRLFFKV